MIDLRGIVSVRSFVEHEGRLFGTAALITQKGVAVMDGDLLPDGRQITLIRNEIEAPGVNGRGEIAFVPLVGGQQAVLLGKPTKGCRNLLDDDVPVPDGYGAAYDVLGLSHLDRELTVRVRCGFSRAILQVGSGDPDQLVNPEAFLWDGRRVAPLALHGEETGGRRLVHRRGERRSEAERGRAAPGAAGARPDLHRSSSGPGQSRRKCGCRDFSCEETFWQLQRFQRQR